MPDLATLGLRVENGQAISELRQFDRAIDNTTRRTESLTRGLRTMAGYFGAGLIARAALQNIIEAQNVTAQLESAIRSTGGAAGRTVKQLGDYAIALQRTSTYSDDAIGSAQGLLLTFTKIRGTEFDAATKATLDLATAMGGDLKGAALQVGKALQDPDRGLQALTRSGVSFSEGQQKVIKALYDTGRVAEAQRLILKELEVQFGGSAAAARNTLGGALAGLQDEFSNLFEVSRDSSSGIIGAINSITDSIPEWEGKLDRFFGKIKEGFTGVKIGYLRDAADIQRVLAFFNEIDGAVFSKLPGKSGEIGRQQLEIAKRQRAEVARLEVEIANSLNDVGKGLFGDVSGSGSTVGRTVKSPFDPVVTDLDKIIDRLNKIKIDFSGNQGLLDMIGQGPIRINSVLGPQGPEYGPNGMSGDQIEARARAELNADIARSQRILAGETDKSGEKVSAFADIIGIASQTIEYAIVQRLGGGTLAGNLGGALGKSAANSLIKGNYSMSGLATGLATGGISIALAGLGAGLAQWADDMWDLSGAAAAAAKAMREQRKALEESLDVLQARARGEENSLGFQKSQAMLDFDKLRMQAREIARAGGERPWGDGGVGSELSKELARIALIEKEYVAMLEKERAIKQQFATEDLEVRFLRASGRNKEADIMERENRQAREIYEAEKAGFDAAYIARLREIHAIEDTATALDKLTTSVRNAPSGFKIESYINSFAEPRPWNQPPTTNIPYSPERPTGGIPKATTTTNTYTVTVKVDGAKNPRDTAVEVVKQLRALASETAGINSPLSQAIDYIG
jgi:hypothetical protein